MAKTGTSYEAKKDYGTRNAELNAQVISFGDYHYTIYQRADSKKPTWYFRMYLVTEKRHYRKSLKTIHLEAAKKAAADAMFETVGKVRSGEKVLAITLGELQKRYYVILDARKAQGPMIEGGLAYNTWKAHRYRINHGFNFIQDTLCKGTERASERRISAIDGKHWDKYLLWRDEKLQAEGKSIRRDVVRDELLSIRKMFHFAKAEGLCNESNIPNWTFECEKLPPTRERMSPGDYMKFIPILRKFVKDAKGEKETYTRLLLQHFLLVVANSGMRSGELFGLKNKFVTIDKDKNMCVLTIKAETSKVKRGRELTFSASRGGAADGTDINYLIRWIENYQIHKEPNDLVFPLFHNGKAEAQDDYYDEYRKLRDRLKEKNLDYMDTYHFRHFWITNRLNQGHSIHHIAKVAGTSVREIEQTYSHVMTVIASADMNKKRREIEDIEANEA